MELAAALLEGISHQQRGHPHLAEAIYRGVLRLEPDQPNALYLYGMLQLADGRAGTAGPLLEQAARLRPDAEVRINLARARLACADYAGALLAADDALAISGPGAPALFLRGTALNALGDPAGAVLALSQAAALDQLHAPTHVNLGNAYADLDDLRFAEVELRMAICLEPRLVEAHVSLGHVLTRQGRETEAIAACETAIGIDPSCAEAHWNLSTALLLTGDFTRGFEEYQWHKRHRDFRAYYRNLPGPVWAGEDVDGKTLLVDAGQGLGDTIQLARYMPLLAAKGAHVVLACDRRLVSFLSAQPGSAAAVARSMDPPPYDCWIDQMGLPAVFGTQPDTIPGGASYLMPDAVRQAEWGEQLPKARIGLCWAGNPLHSNDSRRSLPYDAIMALVRPGMVSLQLGPRSQEAASLGLADVSAQLTDFAATAALVAMLDLVITVDTAVAHLAGAMGVPTWLMLPAAPDWRWIIGRDDTPWYPSMRIFRQPKPGDWTSVAAQVSAFIDVAS